MPDQKQELLRALPSISDLLKSEIVAGWLRHHPRPLVTECLRRALANVREQILAGLPQSSGEPVLAQAEDLLGRATEPHVREAVNATGIILHTGLGRAVIPGGVVDSMMGELKGYCTLAVDRESGERAERDELVEYILAELTGGGGHGR
jgi:L-seryl-tRNA(Ser) seleniumtransferase